MALIPRLELRQGQQLVMTPQLQQAIRLLQLSNVELCSFVEQELERNPLLERDDSPVEPSPDAPDRREVAEREGDDADGVDWALDQKPIALNEPERQSVSDQIDASFAESHPDQSSGDQGESYAREGAQDPTADLGNWASMKSGGSGGSFDNDEQTVEDFVAAGKSLSDHLNDQLLLVISDPAERLIGAHLIHMVDEAGYLQGDLAELADRLGAPLSRIEKVLAVMQTFKTSLQQTAPGFHFVRLCANKNEACVFGSVPLKDSATPITRLPQAPLAPGSIPDGRSAADPS